MIGLDLDTPLAVNLYNVPLLYKNMTGRETRFTPEGYRVFCVELTYEGAQNLRLDGWDVRETLRDGEQIFFLKVRINNESAIRGLRRETPLAIDHKNALMEIDQMSNVKADVELVQRRWEWNDQSGVMAMLVDLFFTEMDDDAEI